MFIRLPSGGIDKYKQSVIELTEHSSASSHPVLLLTSTSFNTEK